MGKHHNEQIIFLRKITHLASRLRVFIRAQIKTEFISAAVNYAATKKALCC